MKIYQDFFHAGQVEGLAQEVENIIGRSNQALIVRNQILKGDYAYESFFQDVNIVSRRDVDSTDAADIVTQVMGETIKIALKRKVGPVDMLAGKFRSLGLSGPDSEKKMSFILGRQVSQQKLRDQINTGLTAAVAALAGQAGVYLDCTGDTIAYAHADNLARALQLFGDMQSRIVCWAMHSATQNDLLRGQISTDAPDPLATALILNATPGSLNRPIVITDSPAFVIPGAATSGSAATPTAYYMLGLTREALEMIETGEDVPDELQRITGGENLSYRYHGEVDYSLGVKGMKWNVTDGGANPDNATLGTSSNWLKAVVNDKNLAGVCIKLSRRAA